MIGKFFALADWVSQTGYKGWVTLGTNIELGIEQIPIEEVYIVDLNFYGTKIQLNTFSLTKEEITDRKELTKLYGMAVKELESIQKKLKNDIKEI